MRNSQLKCLIAILSLLFTGFAQGQSLSGTVSDSKGPLPGVSVTIKGTNNGTSTDFGGTYKINNVSSGSVLVYSMIGYKTQEITATGKSSINVTLNEDASALKEVLVIGYGSVKKKDATGAIDQISAKKFDNIGATSPAELLRGKIAGVQITSSSGDPGAGMAIRVRGNSSVRSGNNPLIVIDGVPLDGGDVSGGGADAGAGTIAARSPLNFINQNDIESMTILKDASSTAIYGARGANGVIMITTKKSKSKEPQLNLSSSTGLSIYSGNLKVLNKDEYLAAGGVNKGGDYDWKDTILRTGSTTNNDLSYSVGGENSFTRLSFGASNTDGIVKNTGIDKYTASLNNSTDFLGGFLKIDTKLLYAGIKDRTTLITENAGFQGNLLSSALQWNPSKSVLNPDGSYNRVAGSDGKDDNSYLNPLEILNSYDDYTNTNKILASIKSTFRISKNLNYQFLFGIENSTSQRNSQFSPNFNYQNTAQVTGADGKVYYGRTDSNNINKFNKTFEHTLNYNRDITENFNLDLVGGFSYYDYNFNSKSYFGVGYNPNQVNLIDQPQGGIQIQQRIFGRRNEVELQSYFGRATLNLYKKLGLNATFRRDGSTKLGENFKYDNFYSFGLAYKLIDEKEGLLNNFKIRGSYGLTGNQEFDPYSALSVVRYNNLIIDTTNPTNANPNLKWETVTSYGGGVDFTFFNNQLSGSFDYFARDTRDLIFATELAATQLAPPARKFVNLNEEQGFSNVVLQNRGFEVSLNYKIINNKDFNWDISANAAFLENKITNYDLPQLETGALNGKGLTGANVQVIKDGYPVNNFFALDFKGYNPDGSSIYTDIDGNPSKDGNQVKQVLDGKQPIPKVNLGFSTSMNYKNFDVAVSFYGAYGHYIYNNTDNALFFKGSFPAKNVTQSVIDAPQSVGDPNSPSTKYIQKGDFLRMGNLTFGYTFKGSVLENTKIKSARLYVNGQNLLLFTDYTGFDPEVDTNKALNGVPSAGIDYIAYPKAKIISFGVNLTF